MTKHGGHPVAVINVDQHASRRRPDLVPDALAELAGVDGLVFQFERTAGDEVQGVCAAPQAVVDVVLRLTRMGGWRIGIGIGAIDEPLPASTRQARGPAYLVAREAIEARLATQSLRLLSALPDQGRGNVGVATYGGFQKAAWYAESALIALRALAGRRTAEGWEVVDLIERGSTQRVVAQQLGITQAAVSQRLTAAGHDELNRLAGLATITLAAAMAWSQ